MCAGPAARLHATVGGCDGEAARCYRRTVDCKRSAGEVHPGSAGAHGTAADCELVAGRCKRSSAERGCVPGGCKPLPDECNLVSGRRKRVPDGCDSEPAECDSVSGGCNRVPAGCSPGQPIAIASLAGASVPLLPASGRSQLCSVPRRGHCRSMYVFSPCHPEDRTASCPHFFHQHPAWSECAAIRASFQLRARF
jgi:hypothetical protein